MPSETAAARAALARVIDPAIYPDINRLTGDGWAASLRAADAVLAALPALGWVRAEGMGEEWGVRWPWMQEVERNTSDGSAIWRAANMHSKDGVVVHRSVSAWVERCPKCGAEIQTVGGPEWRDADITWDECTECDWRNEP